MMAAVPQRERHRIVSGMRWTVWLSALAAPFSYGTMVLLARIGPEALGTYGLLMVYIGVVSALFYFGGDPVTIKFLPALPAERRAAFLASYFLVICGCLMPLLALVTVFPRTLHYLFGSEQSVRFQLNLLYLAPLSIAAAMVLAALKAVLEIKWAQILSRMLTLVTFAAYGLVYLGFRAFFQAHYTTLIWGVYLTLIGATLLLGLARLSRLPEWRPGHAFTSFFLPAGFWRYALALQQASALGFFVQRLDLLLVLNYGGLDMLGKYVAILSVANMVQVASRFFLDTLLPALTNLLAIQHFSAASDVFATHLRLLCFVSATGTSAMIYLIQPVAALMGKQYVEQKGLFILLVLLYGIAIPGSAGFTLLTAVGKQQRTVWLSIVQLALFVILFVRLWPAYHLLGAVLATGVPTVVCNIALLITAKYSSRIRFSMARDYAAVVLVLVSAVVAATKFAPLGIAAAAAAFGVTVGLFLFIGRYRLSELGGYMECFVPGFRKSSLSSVQSTSRVACGTAYEREHMER